MQLLEKHMGNIDEMDSNTIFRTWYYHIKMLYCIIYQKKLLYCINTMDMTNKKMNDKGYGIRHNFLTLWNYSIYF